MRDLCFNTYQSKIAPLLEQENINQLAKWGIQDHDPFQWLAFVVEEVGELSDAISEYHFRGGTPKECVRESIQAATLLLKIAEMFCAEVK